MQRFFPLKWVSFSDSYCYLKAQSPHGLFVIEFSVPHGNFSLYIDHGVDNRSFLRFNDIDNAKDTANNFCEDHSMVHSGQNP